jgi:hypothetical protein
MVYKLEESSSNPHLKNLQINVIMLKGSFRKEESHNILVYVKVSPLTHNIIEFWNIQFTFLKNLFATVMGNYI